MHAMSRIQALAILQISVYYHYLYLPRYLPIYPSLPPFIHQSHQCDVGILSGEREVRISQFDAFQGDRERFSSYTLHIIMSGCRRYDITSSGAQTFVSVLN